MDTLLTTATSRHHTIRVTTERPTEFIDLTERLHALVEEAGIGIGFINVQALHTTTGILVNELEPLLFADFATLLEGLAPRDAPYQHDNLAVRTVNLTADERINGHAHCRALLMGSSVSLNIVNGVIRLGRWQRVLMAELDGPQAREVSVVILGEGRR